MRYRPNKYKKKKASKIHILLALTQKGINIKLLGLPLGFEPRSASYLDRRGINPLLCR